MSNITAQKLDVIETIKDGVGIGIKNLGPILVNVLLWILTCWIPYINIGTTIGLSIGLIAKASKGETISFTEIFDPKYRKFMGEFFLTSGLVAIGTMVGFALMIIPGIIIGIAWLFAPLLVIDKGKNPTESLTISNNITYGNKWRIFGAIFLPSIAVSIACGILGGIGGATGVVAIMAIMVLISFAAGILLSVIVVGIQASMYKQLASNV